MEHLVTSISAHDGLVGYFHRFMDKLSLRTWTWRVRYFCSSLTKRLSVQGSDMFYLKGLEYEIGGSVAFVLGM